MAIEFPSNPVDGQSYDFEQVRYNYVATDNYWRVTTPGTIGPATAAEIDEGTDGQKYVTPLELNGSTYPGEKTVAADLNTGTDDTKFVTAKSLKESNYSTQANTLVFKDSGTTSLQSTKYLDLPQKAQKYRFKAIVDGTTSGTSNFTSVQLYEDASSNWRIDQASCIAYRSNANGTVPNLVDIKTYTSGNDIDLTSNAVSGARMTFVYEGYLYTTNAPNLEIVYQINTDASFTFTRSITLVPVGQDEDIS